MEDLSKVINGIYMNSINPSFCVHILEYGEDPLIEYLVCNKAFDKLVNNKTGVFLNRQIHLSDIDAANQNGIISKMVHSVIDKKAEAYEEFFNQSIGKVFRLKGFMPEPDYVCIIMADVTDYTNARTELQKMCAAANTAAEQLKYQVDLLTVTQSELKRVNHIHEIMFSVSSDGFFYKNYENGVFYAADSFFDLFMVDGVRPIDNLSILNALYEQDVFAYAGVRENAINNKEAATSKEVRLLDGVTWLDTNLKFTYDSDGKLLEEIGFFKDITTIKKQQEELAYHAYFDSVTGLMNRNYFTKLFDEDIEKIKQEDGEIQVVYIDIDDFKKINDSIGFQFGDKLILEFSRLLRRFENDRVRVARFDSDEFVISIYDGTRNDANNISLEIRKMLMKPFELGRGISCLMTVSIGIAEYPTHGRHAIDVISNADIALHHVKNSGKNNTAFFEESMLEELLSKMEMERNIKYALENNEFILYYQPQFYTETKELRGFEALVRMIDENNSIVSPGHFIPVAENNGSIVEIGEWVINQAFEDYNYWHREYGFSGIIAINISTVQFRQVKFENILYSAIERYGIDPTKVEVEITESIFMENQASLIDSIKRIRKKGIRVSLDDFGTGYSSLAYLKNFPVDTLKIDKTFIDFLGKEQKSNIIISSIVEMMRNLGLEIIAEGVETEDQYDILRDLQCHEIQGFFLGRPMNASDIEQVIRKKM